MSSDKKIQANRENALLSTGPKTEEGKCVIKQNAVKHGIFAEETVITQGNYHENANDYAELLSGLNKDLAPVGKMEELLVEKITVNYWRLRRLLRYETGEIRDRLDKYISKAITLFNKDLLQPNKPDQEPGLQYLKEGDPVDEQEIKKQRQRIEQLNELDIRNTQDPFILSYVLQHRLNCNTREPTKSELKTAQDYLMTTIPQQLGRIKYEIIRREEAKLIEMIKVHDWRKKFDIMRSLHSIPLENELNKVIKYESSLERSIFRNLSALKTLQHERKQQQ